MTVQGSKKDNILFLIYWNFSIKNIKNKKEKIKLKNNIVKKTIFIPDTKIKIDQLRKTNKVWPISGCIANNDATANVTKNDNVYLKKIFVYFWLLKIKLIQIIRKGLTNSIGWNLGKKFRSIHLLDPFTSIPIKGTIIKKIIENRKIIRENFKSLSWLIDDKKKITIVPREINIKCLKKKE